MSSPYYRFGYQRRYAYDWSGGPGGIMSRRPWRASEQRALSGDPVTESWVPPDLHFQPFSFKDRPMRGVGDVPPIRPSGPEPLDPGRAPRAPLGFIGSLSTMEKNALLLGGAVLGAYLLLKK
jgi:hypothetical protein